MTPHLTLGAPNVSAVDTSSRVAASRVTWRTLVVAAAIGNLAMLAWLIVSAQDRLALSLVAVLLVGLALTRVRDGLAGRVVLGLAFADMSWYTVSGAILNLVNREGIAAVVIPAWLGSLAVAGLVAAVASILNRSTPDAGRTGALRVGAVALTCFALALAVSAVQGRADKATASQPSIVLVTENMAYSSESLTADAGKITLRMNNHDLFWHTFTIDSLGADLKVAVNGDESVTFNATPGTYEFYCTVPGHAQMGMRGTLVVR
jgi:plastocyanin